MTDLSAMSHCSSNLHASSATSPLYSGQRFFTVPGDLLLTVSGASSEQAVKQNIRAGRPHVSEALAPTQQRDQSNPDHSKYVSVLTL
jgi:hypothetical protein